MPLPSVEIAFRTLASSAVQRSEKGIVALILKDSAAITNPLSLSGVDEIPDKLSEENKKQIKLAFMGGIYPPRKVIAYVLPETADNYQEALQYLETVRWNYLAIPKISENEVQDIATWIKTLRNNGLTVKAVLPSCKADHEGIINFATEWIVAGEEIYSTAEYCSRVAGILAGNPLTIASTYQVLPEVDDVPHVTKEELDEGVDDGKLLLMHDGEKVKIARGVNSLTTITPDKGREFKKIKIVDILDMIQDDIKRTVEDNYIGKVPNDYDHKVLLIAAINTYLEQLEGEMLLDRGQNRVEIDLEAHRQYLKSQGVDVDDLSVREIKEANTDSYVMLAGTIKPLDAMEDITINLII